MWLLLSLLLLPTEKPRPVVEFLHPRVPIVLSGLAGVDVPVSIRIDPHPDNRRYVIAWCNGASARSLDGDNEAAVQPERLGKQSLWTVRMSPGSCELTATVYGPGMDQIRGRASMVVKVCGGDEECHDPK